MSNTRATLIDRKAMRPGGVSTFSIPPMPRLPAKMLDRFPELREYNEAMQAWADGINSTLRNHLSNKE